MLGMLSGWVFTASVNNGKRSSLKEHTCMAIDFDLMTNHFEPDSNNAGPHRYRK